MLLAVKNYYFAFKFKQNQNRNMSESIADESVNLNLLKTEEVEEPKKYKRSWNRYVVLNQYAKQKILAHLQKKGTDKTQCEHLMKKFRCDPHEIEKYVNTQAKNSQNGVKTECDSQTLRAILCWIEGFRDSGLNLIGAKELPLIMKTISLLEPHPTPDECEGIDFQSLYSFIGKVMNGEPTQELSEETRVFLCDILGELVDNINSAEGDMNVLTFRDELFNLYIKETDQMDLKEQMLQIGLNPLILQFPEKDNEN